LTSPPLIIRPWRGQDNRRNALSCQPPPKALQSKAESHKTTNITPGDVVEGVGVLKDPVQGLPES
jgi:hypothetical protein